MEQLPYVRWEAVWLETLGKEWRPTRVGGESARCCKPSIVTGKGKARQLFGAVDADI